jgi:hypothetical protein
VHLKTEEGLVVKRSSIAGAGKGLFAAKRFGPKQKVVRYSAKQVQRRPTSGSQYNLKVAKGKYLDAKSTQTHAGRYINDPRGSGQRANARFGKQRRVYRADGRHMTPVFAQRAIKKGDEVLLSYGRGYWQQS